MGLAAYPYGMPILPCRRQSTTGKGCRVDCPGRPPLNQFRTRSGEQNMFRNMKLSTKIYIGFSIPVAALVTVSVFAYMQTTSVGQGARQTQEESSVYAKLAQDMKLNV